MHGARSSLLVAGLIRAEIVQTARLKEQKTKTTNNVSKLRVLLDASLSLDRLTNRCQIMQVVRGGGLFCITPFLIKQRPIGSYRGPMGAL